MCSFLRTAAYALPAVSAGRGGGGTPIGTRYGAGGARAGGTAKAAAGFHGSKGTSGLGATAGGRGAGGPAIAPAIIGGACRPPCPGVALPPTLPGGGEGGRGFPETRGPPTEPAVPHGAVLPAGAVLPIIEGPPAAPAWAPAGFSAGTFGIFFSTEAPWVDDIAAAEG